MQSTADFPTARASALMGTMAKHFGHKIAVTTGPHQAHLRFDAGMAVISVTQAGLRLSVEADEAGELARLSDVIERHLLRFAHREDPQPLEWCLVPG